MDKICQSDFLFIIFIVLLLASVKLTPIAVTMSLIPRILNVYIILVYLQYVQLSAVGVVLILCKHVIYYSTRLIIIAYLILLLSLMNILQVCGKIIFTDLLLTTLYPPFSNVNVM